LCLGSKERKNIRFFSPVHASVPSNYYEENSACLCASLYRKRKTKGNPYFGSLFLITTKLIFPFSDISFLLVRSGAWDISRRRRLHVLVSKHMEILVGGTTQKPVVLLLFPMHDFILAFSQLFLEGM